MSRSSLLAGWILVAGLAALPAGGAVESLEHKVEIAADGSYIEHRKLTVRLDDRADLDKWRFYAVALDDHRHLLSAEAWRQEPSGRQKRLSRRERDEAEYSGEGITYSSQRFLLFEPDLLEVGSRLIFDIRLAIDPYFPAGALDLQPLGEAVESFRVDVRSAAGPLRYGLKAQDLDGQDLGVVLQDRDRRLLLEGSLPQAIDPPAHAAAKPSYLRFAWGATQEWQDVANWYAEIEGAVEHGGPSFDALTAKVLAAGPTAAERLEAAVDIARRDIRYVAVEVGIGGYRPSPAAETASRGWGDCKDKSLLLIELLRRAGLSAYPALIRLDRSRRIDLDFPTPFDFNHLIVAVEASEELGLDDAAPVSDGFLFIDPTQTLGSATYLHRGVQDQHALVVTAGRPPRLVADGKRSTPGGLVQLPSLPHSELIEVSTEIWPGEDGASMTAKVEMRYLGETASYLTRSLDATNSTDLESAIRRVLLGFFPGAEIGQLTWDGRREGLPAFEVKADLVLATADLSALRVPAPDVFPSLADLDALEGFDGALSPAASRYRTRLHLPEAQCPPRERQSRAQNTAGHFSHTVVAEEGAVEVSFEAVLSRAWHASAELAELRELAVAEHRASRRRLRFQCRD